MGLLLSVASWPSLNAHAHTHTQTHTRARAHALAHVHAHVLAHTHTRKHTRTRTQAHFTGMNKKIGIFWFMLSLLDIYIQNLCRVYMNRYKDTRLFNKDLVHALFVRYTYIQNLYWVYMYICIYVYTYICIYVYTYICIYVYMYTCIYA